MTTSITQRAPLTREQPQPVPKQARNDGRAYASPLACKRITDLGIGFDDLVSGKGRILSADVNAGPGEAHPPLDPPAAAPVTARFTVEFTGDARAMAARAAVALCHSLRREGMCHDSVTGRFVLLEGPTHLDHNLDALEDLDANGIIRRLHKFEPTQKVSDASTTIMILSGIDTECSFPLPDGVVAHLALSTPRERVVAKSGAFAIRPTSEVTLALSRRVNDVIVAGRLINSIFAELDEGARRAS